MTTKIYKYIVTIEGLIKPLEYFDYGSAVLDLKRLMPCKTTIEAKEVE